MDWETVGEFGKKWAPYVVSSGIGAWLWSMWTGYRKRKAEEKKERTTRATILSTFTLEAVELQQRWVQYDRQAKSSHISNSLPYEFTTMDQVNQLVQLGTPREVIHAIYRIKELNANVHSNVTRAQKEVAQSTLAPSGEDVAMHISSLPFQTFGSAAAFISARWDPVCKAIRLLLDAAKRDGVDVTSFLQAVEKNESDYKAQNPPAPLPPAVAVP